MGLEVSVDVRHSRLSQEQFREVIGHFASGVTIITATHEGRPFGTTASAVTSLSLEPPMLVVCMNRDSSTGQAMSAAGTFGVNILDEDQGDLAMRFATKAPDKFSGIPIATGLHGQPLLIDALARLECRVVEQVAGGTHLVFLAEVDGASARPGAPLAYFRGQFGRLEMARDEAAYTALRERVLRRDIAVGQPLSLPTLASELGAPRGSVYHALAKLSGDGLVRRTADGDFFVAPLTLATIEDTLRADRALQVGVALTTVGRVSRDRLAAFRSVMEQGLPWLCGERFGEMDRWIEANRSFHECMVALADSDALLHAYRRLALPAMIARGLSSDDHVDPQLAHDHRQIVEAYEGGDRDAAVEIVERHNDRALSMHRAGLLAAGGAI